MRSITLSNQEKLEIIDSLATMLTAGIPILETVDSLLEESKGNPKKVLQNLKEDLNQGKTVSYSFARHPKAFDKTTVNIIKAAEESGTLESALKDLTASIQKDIDFLGEVKGSLVYPVLVLVVLAAVIILNLFFVIPRISQVFTRLQIKVPLPTKILITVSNFANDNLLFVIAATVILIAAIIAIFKTKKTIITNFLFSLPLITKLIKEIDLARFTRGMALLLKSGIPIDESLQLTEEIVGKKEIRLAIGVALKQVVSGKTLSSGLKKQASLFPSFMVRIIEAGEKSGTLEKSMQDISDQFEVRVKRHLKTITLLIEPFLLLVVGLLVGALMLAIIAPIYNLIGQIGQR